MPSNVNKQRKHILLAYFSATGNTRKIAQVIHKKLKEHNISVTILDITSHSTREERLSLEQYDAVCFGFPIYSMRAPRICREWLRTLDGKGMRCSVFFTYGGFGKDPAHYFIKQLLEDQHFVLVSTAEFLGAHTFNYSGWSAVTNRPNDLDFQVAEDYAMKTVRRFLDHDAVELDDFEKPMYDASQLDQAEKYRFSLITKLPTRDANSCSMCGICQQLCPVHAMDMHTGIANNKCIACFRCIANCPDGVLHTNDISSSWDKKLAMHKMTEQTLEALESKLYF
ncbi:NAD(P)H-dependent oxidoreductase [Vallitalea pronyensis]|uniref:Ferredoxin n=1 Tax=Vallitalea pronyensis TaxID=1348613 RepID=A0A8J8MQD9_9FIRM|nr:EFR1 family ferrodoxin [Vallitalea pronyensis]QUI25533.1 NAD(P)H-dependent oxidoreductase [Vallitalea pronyensis]